MPLPQLNSDGQYQGARLLIWMHGQPIGEVHLSFASEPVGADRLASMLWPLIADTVAVHCDDDGIPAPSDLPPGGLIQPQRPCRTRRSPADDLPITVVIATRDRTESLLRCLDSLAKLEYSSFDVVVVDSAPSTDTTARTLEESQAWPFAVRYVPA